MPRLRRQQGRLRKGGGLKTGRIDPAEIALGAGFDAAGMVNPALLAEERSRIQILQSRQWYSKDCLAGMETEWILDADRWAGAFSILVCALSCHRPEPGDNSSPSDPHALIAPFARRNHYAAAAAMLRTTAASLSRELEIDRKKIRIFVNSRIPEKPLLAASGLGALGRNGLAQVPGLGSLFVIAGAVIPVPSGRFGPGAVRAADPCGTCRLCIEACPAGAIGDRGLVDPDICLQGLASRPGFIESGLKEKWGFRLYGCQDCQSVCPRNRDTTVISTVSAGEIGPSVSIAGLLSRDSDGVRAFFRGTALAKSWIPPEALIRNALMAAGNRRCHSLAPCVSGHVGSDTPFIADAARWALEMCG